MVLHIGVCPLVPAPVPARTLVDVIPPVRLVPKQLSFIQVIRITSVITPKIAVTPAVSLSVSDRISYTYDISSRDKIIDRGTLPVGTFRHADFST